MTGGSFTCLTIYLNTHLRGFPQFLRLLLLTLVALWTLNAGSPRTFPGPPRLPHRTRSPTGERTATPHVRQTFGLGCGRYRQGTRASPATLPVCGTPGSAPAGLVHKITPPRTPHCLSFLPHLAHSCTPRRILLLTGRTRITSTLPYLHLLRLHTPGRTTHSPPGSRAHVGIVFTRRALYTRTPTSACSSATIHALRFAHPHPPLPGHHLRLLRRAHFLCHRVTRTRFHLFALLFAGTAYSFRIPPTPYCTH